MIKNRLILTGIFIEMGVIEIEYELNKINVFTKSDEEPYITGICRNELILTNFRDFGDQNGLQVLHLIQSTKFALSTSPPIS